MSGLRVLCGPGRREMIHCLGGLCVPGGLFCFRFYQPLFTPLLVTQWVVGGGGFCGVCLCRSIFVFRIFAFLFCDAYFFFLVFCLFLLCWWFCFIPDDCVGRCVDGAYNVMCILCCSLPGGVVCRRTKTFRKTRCYAGTAVLFL